MYGRLIPKFLNYDSGCVTLSIWKHSTSLITSSCFTSQPSGWKQDTRLALRHSCQAGSIVLVSSHRLALRHSNKDGSKILVLLYVTAIKLEAGY
jgi:hypothetical protein